MTIKEKIRILLTGKYTSRIADLISNIPKLHICKNSPDIIIAYGGDGALLGVEREYPRVPKFPIRDKETASLCKKHSSYSKQLQNLAEGKLRKTMLRKICGNANGKICKGINDVFIHNANPVSAIRYRVKIDGVPYGEEIVGDGVGVSTVHGSTAYYRSITHSIFRTGIGLAFSNSTELTNHLVIPENSFIEIYITRGPAVFVCDNSPDIVPIDTGEKIEIFMSDDYAEILGLDIFMCNECRKLRHPRE